MSKSKNKIKRYNNLIRRVENWPSYLLSKLFGFKKNFVFKVKGFGKIAVPKHMLGPFRENFLDNIYLSRLPDNILVKEKPVVLDIGANVGYFSLSVLAKYPNARLYAFEPHPYCFDVMEDYKKQYPHFELNIIDKAVSNNNDKIPLYISAEKDFTTTSSIYNKDDKPTKKILASAMRLEDFIKEEKLTNIDLLKLDCEGSEYDILYDLHDSTFEGISALAIETHRGEKEGQNFEALYDYIKNKGYKLTGFNEGFLGYIWAWK